MPSSEKKPKKPFKSKPVKPTASMFDDDEDDELEVAPALVMKEELGPLAGELLRDARLRIVRSLEDEQLDEIKKWSCAFYQGHNPACAGCRQPEEKVLECREYYLERAPKFPLLDNWVPAFDQPVIKLREKISLDKIQNVGVTCDSCYMAEKCPYMEHNSSCAIDFGVPDDELTPDKVFDGLIKLQAERVKRQSTFEKIDGGVADGNLSGEMDRLASLVERKDNMGTPRMKMTLEGTGDSGTKAAGGLLASIFGAAMGAGKPVEALPEATTPYIDITTPEFVEEPKETKRKTLPKSGSKSE